jgi:hypothetical protein
MKTFDPEEKLHSLMRIFELCGLQFFSFKTLKSEISPKRLSIFRVAQGVCFVAFFIIIACIEFIFTKSVTQDELNAKNFLTIAIWHSSSFCLAFVKTVSIVQSFNSIESTKRFLTNSSEVIRNVQKSFGLAEDYTFLTRSSWRRFLLLTFFVISAQFSLLAFYGDSHEEFMYVVVTTPSIMYLLLLLYRFTLYVSLVNDQLRFLSAAVLTTFDSYRSPSIEIINNRLRCVKQKGVSDPLTRLQAAKNSYNLIYESGSLINQSFGVTILVLIVVVVILLMSLFYESFMIVVGEMPKTAIPGNLLNCVKISNDRFDTMFIINRQRARYIVLWWNLGQFGLVLPADAE